MHNTDHYGGDIRLELFNEYKDCKKSCEEDPICEKWTFRNRKDHGHCYLKEATANTVTSCRHCITGLKTSSSDHCSKEGSFQANNINQKVFCF